MALIGLACALIIKTQNWPLWKFAMHNYKKKNIEGGTCKGRKMVKPKVTYLIKEQHKRMFLCNREKWKVRLTNLTANSWDKVDSDL